MQSAHPITMLILKQAQQSRDWEFAVASGLDATSSVTPVCPLEEPAAKKPWVEFCPFVFVSEQFAGLGFHSDRPIL